MNNSSNLESIPVNKFFAPDEVPSAHSWVS